MASNLPNCGRLLNKYAKEKKTQDICALGKDDGLHIIAER